MVWWPVANFVSGSEGMGQSQSLLGCGGDSAIAARKQEDRWEPVVAQVSLPLEFTCNSKNMVIKVAAEESVLQVGDYITHVDGVEVRAGSKTIEAAVDELQPLHTIAAQRLVTRKKGTSTFTVRLSPADGRLGIGCTQTNVIREIYRGGAADQDGRLQVNCSYTVPHAPASDGATPYSTLRDCR